MSSVTLKNMKKIYPNGVLAVDNFSLEVADKEFIIIVGPSGCGKSTALRMIAGLEEITAGELYIDDVFTNEVHAKDRDIAMVFQNYALYPHMTVFENISFGLKIRGVPRDEIKSRVDDAAKILEIEELMERKPAQLSGGQRQRVALGRAIVRNPKVFLFDEPLSNLDALLRTAMRAELSKLHQRLETTFIYVTHDQTEAMTMGTRIVVMKDGYIEQIAPPQELYQKPGNLFVATFIGTPQMNTVEAVIRAENEILYLEFGAGLKLPLPESRASKLLEYADKQVIFGIRPHDIHIEDEYTSAHPDWTLDCEVDLTELLGAEINLYLMVSGVAFTSVVATKAAGEVGKSLKMCFDMECAHIFDAETEIAI